MTSKTDHQLHWIVACARTGEACLLYCFGSERARWAEKRLEELGAKVIWVSEAYGIFTLSVAVPGITVTRLTQPRPGGVVALHCSECKVTIFVYSPYIPEKDTDYWKIESCANIHWTKDFPLPGTCESGLGGFANVLTDRAPAVKVEKVIAATSGIPEEAESGNHSKLISRFRRFFSKWK